MKKYLFITLFALSLAGYGQITTQDCATERTEKGITLTINCTRDKAALILSKEIKARETTTFFNAGNPCLVIVYREKVYEVTGVDPETVLFTSSKLADVRKFAKGILLTNL